MYLDRLIKRWTTYRGTSSPSSNSSTDNLTSATPFSDVNIKRHSVISSSSPPRSSSSSTSSPPSPSRSPEPVEQLPKISNSKKKSKKASSAPSTRSTTPLKGGGGFPGNGNGKGSMETPPLSCCSKEIAEDPFARVCPSPIPFKKRPPISPLSSSSHTSNNSNLTRSAYPFTPPNSAHNSLVCSPTSFSSSFSSSSASHSHTSKLSSSSSISSLSGVSNCSTITYATLETPSTSPNLAVSFSSSSTSSSTSSSVAGMVDKNKRLPLPPTFMTGSEGKKEEKDVEKEGLSIAKQALTTRKAAHPYSKFIEHGLDVFDEEPSKFSKPLSRDDIKDLAFSNLVEIPSSASSITQSASVTSPQQKFSKMRSFTAPPSSLAQIQPSSLSPTRATPLHSYSSSSSFSLIASSSSPSAVNAARPVYIKKNKSMIGLPREKQRFDPENRSSTSTRRMKHASADLLGSRMMQGQNKSDCLGSNESEGKTEADKDWSAQGF